MHIKNGLSETYDEAHPPKIRNSGWRDALARLRAASAFAFRAIRAIKEVVRLRFLRSTRVAARAEHDRLHPNLPRSKDVAKVIVSNENRLVWADLQHGVAFLLTSVRWCALQTAGRDLPRGASAQQSGAVWRDHRDPIARHGSVASSSGSAGGGSLGLTPKFSNHCAV
jgi:hypothetical protein